MSDYTDVQTSHPQEEDMEEDDSNQDMVDIVNTSLERVRRIITKAVKEAYEYGQHQEWKPSDADEDQSESDEEYYHENDVDVACASKEHDRATKEHDRATKEHDMQMDVDYNGAVSAKGIDEAAADIPIGRDEFQKLLSQAYDSSNDQITVIDDVFTALKKIPPVKDARTSAAEQQAIEKAKDSIRADLIRKAATTMAVYQRLLKGRGQEWKDETMDLIEEMMGGLDIQE